MKIVLLGNSGAGKSTLAKKLIGPKSVAGLSLDEVAFDGGSTRRAVDESVADVKRFIASHANWIIEGCYADIIEPVLSECEELIFLNPGVRTCISHCRARPWEPDKFGSPEQQDANLENLIAWVAKYDTREDEYGLKRHRALFKSFQGIKREFTQPAEYG